jgi:DNA-binding CsgD family transcriptional regulator/PAS domain-containing protein
MSEPSGDDLLDLVGLIYETALAPDGWDPLLQRLTNALGGNGTVFFMQDRRGPRVEMSRVWGLPEAAVDEWRSHFAAIDVGLDILMSNPVGAVHTEDSLPQDVYAGSEFYNEFRRPWRIEAYVASNIFRDARRFAVFAVQGEKRLDFGEPQRIVLERLVPHLRRAVQLQANLGAAIERQALLEDTLEAVAVGVLLLDESGDVVHANAAARHIIGRGDGLRLRERRLRASSPSADRALQQAIAGAVATRDGLHPLGGAALSVSRSQHGSYQVLVSPGPGAGARSELRRASAIVMIGDPDAGLVSSERLLARLYGLTPSEARLARAVASGDSLAFHAEQCGIAVSTVRWTMKQLLHKTGVRRQADLVRLLLTGPASVREEVG